MKYKLGEICDFINGGAWSDKEYVNEGLPVLKVTNCKTQGFNLADINHLPLSLAKKYEKNKLKICDVIIATVGSHPNLIESAAGRTYIVNTLVDGFYLNQNAVCLRTKDKDILDQKYLGYHSKYRLFQHYIQMSGRGAANQMRIPISAIKNYEFDFPKIEIQQKVGKILSAYDDLIENNQKQIKLLEEAAQRLYKEWFVDLRFPGYETTPIIDGVPEGWKMGKLEEIIIYHDKRRKPLSSLERDTFKGEYRYFGAAGILDYVADYLFDGTYLLFGEDGTVITDQQTPVLQYVTGKFWVNNHAHVLTGKSYYTTEYLYMMFKNMKVSDIVTGVAQPKISQARLSGKKILIPKAKIVIAFQEKVENIFKCILNLEKKNELAKEARDRLIPKLMSGESEV